MRRKRHARFWTDADIDEEQAGILGELAFAQDFRLDPLPIVRRDGVGPVDFVLEDGTTVDVKSSWKRDIDRSKKHKGGRLMVEHGHVGADVYVFVIAWPDDGTGSAFGSLVGWATAVQVKLVPATVEQGNKSGLRSHRIPVAKLRDIAGLKRFVEQNADARRRDRQYHMSRSVEQREDFVSHVVYGLRWSEDRKLADVLIDGKEVGIVYAATDRDDKTWWYVLGDAKNKQHKSSSLAIASLIGVALGTAKEKERKLTDREIAAHLGSGKQR